MLENIRVVMVRTFHPGNIGSAARAMKTMGLGSLYLVSPVDFPSEESDRLAMSATDVLERATVVHSLMEAVGDCSLVIASSARSREFDLPEKTPEQSALSLLERAAKGEQVALVLGPERYGLSNTDLSLAHQRVLIPTHPDLRSLNVASAMQTLAYEIYKQSLDFEAGEGRGTEVSRHLPTIDEKERLYEHLENTLVDTGFLIHQHPGKLMVKLRALFDRAELDVEEVSILRGILASVQRKSD